MTENIKRQYAVEWFANKTYELFEQYSEGNFDRITLNKLMLEALEEAKEREHSNIWAAVGPYCDLIIKYKKLLNKAYEQ